MHRSWGPRRIVFELSRLGVVAVPSESGVYRGLVRAGLVEPGRRRRRWWWNWPPRSAGQMAGSLRNRCAQLAIATRSAVGAAHNELAYPPGVTIAGPWKAELAPIGTMGQSCVSGFPWSIV